MLEILDTTLRDGAQSSNISFSIMDKLDIIYALDSLGIRYIEAGSPSFNETDKELFKTAFHTNAEIVGFGKTRAKGHTVLNDETFFNFSNTNVLTLCIYGKCSLSQVADILKATRTENLDMIKDSVSYLVEKGKKVIFDAEHFFDGYKFDKEYAMQCLAAAYNSGADRLVLCDTNGGSLPEEISEITRAAVLSFPNAIIGIHCHNDNGLSVANSLEAVKSGARHIQGTLLGFGERCGNANLSNLLPLLKYNYANELISDTQLAKLTSISKQIAEISNVILAENTPYIGGSAFSHKAGTHIDGILKSYSSFEHIDPILVGNKRKLLLSDNSGRMSIIEKIKPICSDLDKDDERISAIVALLKDKENQGYQYEGAENSFLLLVDNFINQPTENFVVEDYQISSSLKSSLITATITIRVGEVSNTLTAEGNGPVNALDLAMRKCLCTFYEKVNRVNLIDYKVRVINPKGATGAVVRVLITTTDGNKIIKTIGVSEDIIKASFEALLDSYKILLNDNR